MALGRYFFIVLFSFLTTLSNVYAENKTTGYQQHSAITLSLPSVSKEGKSYGSITLRLDKGWHTYWENPGDAGLPPAFNINNENIALVDTDYPPPQTIPEASLITYGYKDQVTFPITLETKQPLTSDTVTFSLNAEWLVCKDICIPETALLTLAVPVTTASAERPAPLISAETLEANYNSTKETLQINHVFPTTDIYFYPHQIGAFKHQLKQKVSQNSDVLTIKLPVNGKVNQPISGLLKVDDSYYPLQVNVIEGSTGLSLVNALLFALLGGLILNIMPCVFPVLALKISSVLSGERHIRRISVVYAGYCHNIFCSSRYFNGAANSNRLGLSVATTGICYVLNFIVCCNSPKFMGFMASACAKT